MPVLVKATRKRRAGLPRRTRTKVSPPTLPSPMMAGSTTDHTSACTQRCVDIMIVTSNLPVGHKAHMPKVDLEVKLVNKVVRPQWSTKTVKQPDGFSGLRCSLSRYRAKNLHLVMHGDAEAYCTDDDGGTPLCAMLYTLGLVKKDGSLDIVDPRDIVALLEPYSVMNGGDTEFIFLNACRSDGYGMSLNAKGFVVVCWSTRVNDAAAQPFAVAFYEARVKNNASWQEAFDFAVKIISVDFELRDPDDVTTTPATTKDAAGIPKLFL